MKSSLLLGVTCLAFASAAGCRGGVSEDPPIHLAPDMDSQPHRRPQTSSKIFGDGRASRTPEPHTIARDEDPDHPQHLKLDDALFRGVDASGKPIARVPFQVTSEVVQRGEERFNIFCTPCHDKTGGGNGLVAQRGGAAFADMPALWLARLRNDENDGAIFRTITEGKGRMPAYAAQIPERDRWAIVTWVRVLQEMGAAAEVKQPSPAPPTGAK